jgi:hypothetical protein
MQFSINNNIFTQNECTEIIHFCLKHGVQYAANPSNMTSWDCKRIYDEEFKTKILNKLIDNYKNGKYKLWFNFNEFNFKNFNISLTSYYNDRYLYLHKDNVSELTITIVLSDGFEGGQFALTEDKNPQVHFETLNGLTLYDLKLGDSISFNGSQTYHGVLPVTNGTRYALNVWMTETDFDYPKLKSNKTLL